MRNRPELDIADARGKIANGEKLLTDEQKVFLEAIENGASVLELSGGLGLVGEHLSERANVKLCEDGRLYFTYRRQIFPESKVTEMNISPYALSTNNKLTDYIIIHSPEYIETAKKLAKKSVMLMYNLSIVEPEVKNGTVDINSSTNSGNVTKDNGDKTISKRKSKAGDAVLNDELSKSTGDIVINDASVEPVLDME